MIDDLTVIVPVFNESKLSIFTTLENIRTYLHDCKVIFVNDHSSYYNTLDTFNLLESAINVSVIDNDDYGQESALYTGIRAADTTYIACMDCDGQDPVETLAQMYRIIKSTDVRAVAGVRRSRDDSRFRVICASIYHSLFQKTLGRHVPAVSNFFIIHKDIKNKIDPGYVRGIIYLLRDVKYVAYKREKRQVGKSKFTLLKLLKVAAAGLRFARIGERWII